MRYVTPYHEPFVLDAFIAYNKYIDNNLNNDFMDYEFVPPSMDDLRLQCSQFLPIHTQWNPVNSSIAEAILRTAGYMNSIGTVKNWLVKEHLLLVPFIKNKSPGIHYVQRGYKDKATAYPLALTDALMFFETIINGAWKRKHQRVASMAARGRRVNTDTRNEKTPGRLILNVDFSTYLLESIAAIPVLELIKKSSKIGGGIMLGLGPFNNKWPLFVRDVIITRDMLYEKFGNKYSTYYSLDFSRFDRSMHSSIITTAINILSSCFQGSGIAENRYWKFVRENVINTKILDYGGFIYRKKHGMASGDKFTSILDSIVSMLYGYYIFHRVKGTLDGVAVWSFGDDILILDTNKHPIIYDNDIITLSASEVHQKISWKKSIITQTEGTDGINFLSNGTHPITHLPTRTFDDMILRLYVPEYIPSSDDKTYYNWLCSRCLSFYLTFYWNQTCRNFLFYYYEKIKLSFPDFEFTGFNYLKLEYTFNKTYYTTLKYKKLPDTIKVLNLYLDLAHISWIVSVE